MIIPVVYESINYQLSDKAMGVKYILGGLEHMHFVPNIDDYEFSLNKLMDTLKQHCKNISICMAKYCRSIAQSYAILCNVIVGDVSKQYS